jgi:hypothetical protein
VELIPTSEFVERLEQEAGGADNPREDFRRSVVRPLQIRHGHRSGDHVLCL